MMDLSERFEYKLRKPVKQEYYQLFDKLTANYLGNRYPDFINDVISSVGGRCRRYYHSKNKGGICVTADIKTINGLESQYVDDVRQRLPVKPFFFARMQRGPPLN
jgi:hypothetical protein